MKARDKKNGFDWSSVDDVLLDLDGTLLDRHFDNVFFEVELPRRYAAKHGLGLEVAQERLVELYRAVEGQLVWADLHYWTGTLGIDTVALTRELKHLITFLPDAQDFLHHLRSYGKRVYVVTNAHDSGLQIKVTKTGVDQFVTRIVNAFEIGHLKMHPEFWPICHRLIGFDPKRCLYIDDDEACLTAAQQFGLRHLYHRSKSSSQDPPQPSSRFASIESLQELIASSF